MVPSANGDSNLSAYGQENEDQPIDPHLVLYSLDS